MLLAGGLGFGASVRGKVELRDSKDPAVRKRQDYSSVVISLEPVEKNPTVPRRAKMVQKDKTFLPHVLPIVVGSTVDFPNMDPIFHSAFSNYNGQLFDVGLYPPGTSKSVRFARPGVVRVFCNIHATMSAIIAVLDTPYFATSAADGSWEIPNVPVGEYTVKVFHERSTAATLSALTRKITVSGEPLSLPAMQISESGYLAIPHKNKFGKEYGETPDDKSVYPAVRK
jgi:plastocyanin